MSGGILLTNMSTFSPVRATRFDLNDSALPGEPHIYPPAIELFNQDAYPASVYFIHKGIVKLTRCEANGNEVLLDLRFPGSFVGSAAVISEKPHPATAVTVTRCRLIRCNSREFLSLLATDAAIAARVSQTLSDEVLGHVARISQLTCLPARQRLEQLLWSFCERAREDEYTGHEQPSRLQLPLKHYEVANLLSITPTYLCRVLNILENERVITRNKGWIIIERPSKLVSVS